MNDQLKQLDIRTLRLNLYLTQGLVLTAAAVGSFLLHGWHGTWVLFSFPGWRDLVYAVCGAVLVAAASIGMERLLPQRWQDDGQVNEQIFLGLSTVQTILLCTLIGIGEEWLFRGVVQPMAGNLLTSLLFTLVHVRYVRKPLMFASVFATSCLLGALFDLHARLLPPIVAHVAIDLLLAVYVQRVKAASDNDLCATTHERGETPYCHEEGRK